jgi:hypothetical protein
VHRGYVLGDLTVGLIVSSHLPYISILKLNNIAAFLIYLLSVSGCSFVVDCSGYKIYFM